LFKNLNLKWIFTKKRSLIITPQLLKKYIYVYNGHGFVGLLITQKMLGKKLGDFSPTCHMGKNIHNSERNRKKKDKLKNRK